MKLSGRALRALSLAGTMGGISLLLGCIGAEYTCAETPIDRTFDVTTSCDGEHAGRVRVKGSVAFGLNVVAIDLTKVSGDVNVGEALVGGGCPGPDEPSEVSEVSFNITFSQAAGSGGGAVADIKAFCTFELRTDLGKDVTCTISTGGTCSARLTSVQ